MLTHQILMPRFYSINIICQEDTRHDRATVTFEAQHIRKNQESRA